MRNALVFLLVFLPAFVFGQQTRTTCGPDGRTIDTRTYDGNRETVRDSSGRTLGTIYHDKDTETARDSSGSTIWKRRVR